jgi:hypothetical protein
MPLSGELGHSSGLLSFEGLTFGFLESQGVKFFHLWLKLCITFGARKVGCDPSIRVP